MALCLKRGCDRTLGEQPYEQPYGDGDGDDGAGRRRRDAADAADADAAADAAAADAPAADAAATAESPMTGVHGAAKQKKGPLTMDAGLMGRYLINNYFRMHNFAMENHQLPSNVPAALYSVVSL